MACAMAVRAGRCPRPRRPPRGAAAPQPSGAQRRTFTPFALPPLLVPLSSSALWTYWPVRRPTCVRTTARPWTEEREGHSARPHSALAHADMQHMLCWLIRRCQRASSELARSAGRGSARRRASAPPPCSRRRARQPFAESPLLATLALSSSSSSSSSWTPAVGNAFDRFGAVLAASLSLSAGAQCLGVCWAFGDGRRRLIRWFVLNRPGTRAGTVLARFWRRAFRLWRASRSAVRRGMREWTRRPKQY